MTHHVYHTSSYTAHIIIAVKCAKKLGHCESAADVDNVNVFLLFAVTRMLEWNRNVTQIKALTEFLALTRAPLRRKRLTLSKSPRDTAVKKQSRFAQRRNFHILYTKYFSESRSRDRQPDQQIEIE
jgi:hypothetical protein